MRPVLLAPRKSCLWLIALLASGASGIAETAAAQAVRSGEIAGVVSDTTGATLPGVTVTITSPALQVPQLAKISGARGEYQFTDLPPGAYQVTYDLSGFARLVHEDIRLTAGFAARLDVVMKVASVEETVTVTGASPLVDVKNTRGGTTVSKELLAATPNSQNMQDVFLLVGGVQIPGAPLNGETGVRHITANFRPITYGQGGIRSSHTIDGVIIDPNDAPDFASADEVSVKTFGNSAEVCCPGEATHLIVKSGGNQFHGRYKENGQHRNFQSRNVDAALRAQGISAGNSTRYFNEFSADLGGRIVPDALWFYGAFHDFRGEKTAPGFSRDRGADGVYGTIDDTPATLAGTTQNYTGKLSYQMTATHRLVGFAAFNPVTDGASEGSRFIPFETSVAYRQPFRQAKLEWQGALTPRLLVTTMFADSGFDATRRIQEMSLTTPNRFDRESSFQTGASFNNLIGTRGPWRKQLSGTASYYPSRRFAGSHEITAGYSLLWETFKVDFPSQQTGNYRLVYDRVGGVSRRPAEFWTHNYPVVGEAEQNTYALYVSDSWQPVRRLTLNLGVRFERNVAFVSEQTKVPGPFGNSGEFPRVDVGTWMRVAPRVGAAWDLLGDGRTVVKGTYGWYDNMWGYDFASGYSQNYVTTTTYLWRDQDGNNDYTPGEVNLNSNGLDFLTTVGAATNIVNPDLDRPHTHEMTTAIERELPRQMSVRGLYVYKKAVGNTASVNVLRPYGVYNQALTRRDPGPDAVLGTADDGGSVTFYDYDPAYRGSRFVANMLQNATDRTDSYQNFELTLNRRSSGRWFAFSSFLATKNHRWLAPVVQSPNDNLFPLDDSWAITYRLAAGYEAPYGIQVSTLYQAYDGIPGQRTNRFATMDPDGGPAIPSSGTLLLRVEPFGTRQGEQRHLVNLRASKAFELGGARRLTLDVDALNAFNSNVAWGDTTGTGINYQSGPTFGYVTSIVSPRTLRFGVAFEF